MFVRIASWEDRRRKDGVGEKRCSVNRLKRLMDRKVLISEKGADDVRKGCLMG